MMKTYNIFFVIITMLLFSCNKSESNDTGEENGSGVPSDYVVLLDDGSSLSAQLLNANAEVITLNPAASAFGDKPIPELKYVDGTMVLQYHKTASCESVVTQHNFTTDATTEITVFDDLSSCDVTATAILASEDAIYVSYVVAETSGDTYGLRIIDATTSDFSFVDVAVALRPIDLALANNRLFVLGFDEQITDENTLYIMNLSTNTFVHEMDLGYDANRIFSNHSDDVIISYNDLHTNLDSNTLAVDYTQYDDGKSPKFTSSNSRNIDANGRLYYASDPGSISDYSMVATTYDFEKNLIVRYVYEQILSVQQRDFEFEIETTTAVGFDSENNMILVGYEKISGTKKGGLMRILLDEENNIKAIDNINLDGVPSEIIVK